MGVLSETASELEVIIGIARELSKEAWAERRLRIAMAGTGGGGSGSGGGDNNEERLRKMVADHLRAS
jgi:hypothetical protein